MIGIIAKKEGGRSGIFYSKVVKVFAIFILVFQLILSPTFIASAVSVEEGSIYGCKYEDVNNNGVIDSEEQTLSGWFITLRHGSDDPIVQGSDDPIVQETGVDGCYAFEDLIAGYYQVCEDEIENLSNKPYEQTYPYSCHGVMLGSGEQRYNVDFANYLPSCGNGIIDTGYDGYIDEECDGGNSCSQECELVNSISGCKYNDLNNNGIIDVGEEKIINWEIILSGDADESQLTDENGCYNFTGLLEGNYTISEGENLSFTPFVQTFPMDSEYNITVVEGESNESIDFLNYFPVCGNEIIDVDFGEVCELNDTQNCDASGYNGSQNCSQDCNSWDECLTDESCGDGTENGNEECDTTEPAVCTTDDGYSGTQACTECLLGECVTEEFCGDMIQNGNEECDNGNQEDDDGCSAICEIEEGPQCTDLDEDGYYAEGGSCGEADCDDENYDINPGAEEICGNGIDENCDGIDEGCLGLCTDFDEDGYATQGGDCGEIDCNDEDANINPGTQEICGDGVDNDCDGVIDEGCGGGGGSGGGGGGAPISLYIHTEQVEGFTTSTAQITWHTNKLATSRIVYGILSPDPIGSWPNLGYASTTEEISEKTTFHTLSLNNLLSGASYYLRVISSASEEIFGDELTFTTESLPIDTMNSEEDSNPPANGEEQEQGGEEKPINPPAGGEDTSGAESGSNEGSNPPAGGETGNSSTNEPTGSTSGESDEEGQVLGEQVENEDQSEVGQPLLGDKKEEEKSQPEIDQSPQDEIENTAFVDDEDGESDAKEYRDTSFWQWFLLILLIAAGYYGYRKYQKGNGKE